MSESAESLGSAESSESPAPHVVPSIEFFDLNDDCLYKILRTLPDIDLCNVANTNSRLKTLAEHFFMSREVWEFDIKEHDSLQYDDYHVIIETVGCLILSAKCVFILHTDRAIRNFEIIMELLNQHCPHLQTLILEGDRPIDYTIPGFIALMKRVSCIRIRLHEFQDPTFLVANSISSRFRLFTQNLVEISINESGSGINVNFWGCVLRNLRMFYCILNCDFTSFEYTTITNFLRLNSNLTVLTLKCVHNGEIPLGFVGSRPNLTELSLDIGEADIRNEKALSSLQNREKLYIRGSNVDSFKRILDHVSASSLRRFKMAFNKTDFVNRVINLAPVFEGIVRLLNLSQLEIRADGFNFYDLQHRHMLKVIRHLKKCKTLRLDCHFEGNVDIVFFEQLKNLRWEEERGSITLIINEQIIDEIHRTYFRADLCEFHMFNGERNYDFFYD